MKSAGSPTPWTWSIGPILLEVRHGSLLEAPERTWVNSEQTDFLLDFGPSSISGQLLRAWPQAQVELNEQTGGRVLPAGTVLKTSGPDGRCIYHAGFHGPQDWLWGKEDRVAVFLDSIRECTEKILTDAVTSEIPEVAFPLIGTGVFGLPVASFVRMFFETVATFGQSAGSPLRVVLYVWEKEQLEEIVRYGTQSLAAMLAGGRRLLKKAGGHSLVRELRPFAREQADEILQERNLLHFAEVALQTDLAVGAEGHGLTVRELLRACAPKAPGIRLSFGLVSDRLKYVTAMPKGGLPKWLKERQRWLGRKLSRKAIARLVADRNSHAHYNQPRPVADMVKDLENLFGPEALPDPWPEKDEGTWIRKFDSAYGLLESVNWIHGKISWLLPSSRMRVSEPYEADTTAS